LQELTKAILDGFTGAKQLPSVQAFKKLVEQLTVEYGLILLDGHRIDIPNSMRRDVLAILHSSHQGIERIKRRARQTVYWPAINSDIQNTVQSCSKCQESLPSLQNEASSLKTIQGSFCWSLLSCWKILSGVRPDRLSGWIKISEFHQDLSS